MKHLVLPLALVALIAAAWGCGVTQAPTAPVALKAGATPGPQAGGETECERVTRIYGQRIVNMKEALQRVKVQTGEGPALDALLEEYERLRTEAAEAILEACGRPGPEFDAP